MSSRRFTVNVYIGWNHFSWRFNIVSPDGSIIYRARKSYLTRFFAVRSALFALLSLVDYELLVDVRRFK